jgi:hypothetical protein
MNLITTMCLLSLVNAGYSQMPPSTKVPKWVGEDLPFDADRYFTLPEENAAPSYNLAFKEFSEEMYWKNPETSRAKLIRDREAQFNQLYDRFQNNPESVPSSEIERVLKPYEKGFELLRTAQQNSDCVFPITIEGIGTIKLPRYLQAAREVGRVLELKIYHDLQSGKITEAIQKLGTQLRLSRDLRPRGQDINQLIACVLEQVAFEKSVPRILEASNLDPEDCRNLLQLLIQHQQTDDLDPVILSEQYNQLFWRKLFYQLAREDFDPAAVAAEYRMQLTNPTVGTVLIPVIDTICGYELNSDELLNIARQLAKENPQLAELLKRVKEPAAADESFREKLGEKIAALVIQKRIGLNQNVGFGHDRKILNRRYAQIAQVRRLSEPDRVKKLEAFEQQWAPNTDVSDTALLQLFEPAPITAVGRAEQRSTLLLRVAQCLSAVKHWELEHGRLPPDLKSATEYVGLNDVPLDPHNGEPIQLRLNDEPVIHAPGADRQWPIPRQHKPSKR